MIKSSASVLNFTAQAIARNRELVEAANAENSPLERLLACIIDAYPKAHDKSRRARIRDAQKLLTGIDINRVDDPTGLRGRALYKMAEYEYEEYVNGVRVDLGGPPEEADEPARRWCVQQYAKRVVNELGLTSQEEEILGKKYAGNYSGDRKARSGTTRCPPTSRLVAFDADAEEKMRADFEVVAIVLAKYGISMDLRQVFWRTREDF